MTSVRGKRFRHELRGTARLEHTLSGWVFRARCLDCGGPVTLECGEQDPSSLPGWESLRRFAETIVCSACQRRVDGERRARVLVAELSDSRTDW